MSGDSYLDFDREAKKHGNKCLFALADLVLKSSFAGAVFRVAPNMVACGDPAELRRIWSVRSGFNKSDWYNGLRVIPDRDYVLTMRDPAQHHDRRARLMPGYTGREVKGLPALIDEQIAKLVRLIEMKFVSEGPDFRPVDFARLAQFFTLDVTGSIAFGEPFGFLDNNEDMFDYVGMSNSYLPWTQLVALVPWLVKLFQSPLMANVMPRPTDQKGLGKLMGIAKSAVEKRVGDGKIETDDILGSFISHGLDPEEAEIEALLLILAGADTSSKAIGGIMLHLITSPGPYGRLQEELDLASASGSISSHITDDDAKRLPYLQAVIKEGLRMWPPVSGIAPRVSKTDETVCGLHIPAGTSVTWAAWPLQRHKPTFGEDADIFRPERWLEAEPEKQKAMESAMMTVFGVGRPECLGKNIALLNLNKTLSEVRGLRSRYDESEYDNTRQLLLRYDFTIVNASKPWRVFSAGVFIQYDMNVRITRRKEFSKQKQSGAMG
jgi:cytochrome P450